MKILIGLFAVLGALGSCAALAITPQEVLGTVEGYTGTLQVATIVAVPADPAGAPRRDDYTEEIRKVRTITTEIYIAGEDVVLMLNSGRPVSFKFVDVNVGDGRRLFVHGDVNHTSTAYKVGTLLVDLNTNTAHLSGLLAPMTGHGMRSVHETLTLVPIEVKTP